MKTQLSRVSTIDGAWVQAAFFQSKQEPKAAVLIVPAMGIRQDYYATFAKWLANQGYLVATFDYSGIGLSKSCDLRESQADIFYWAQVDCDAMIGAVQERAKRLPIYWLGHSLGGQILGLLPNWGRIAKAVTIATGSGYWMENAPSIKWKAWWLWFVVAPLATRVFGYFPGKRLRKVGDLPRGVMDQWCRWCRDPDYVVGAEGRAIRERFSEITIPIASFSFTDDAMMSARNVESMHQCYSSSPRVMKRISPQEIGVERIGHFGFFRPNVEDSLWRNQLLPELLNRPRNSGGSLM